MLPSTVILRLSAVILPVLVASGLLFPQAPAVAAVVSRPTLSPRATPVVRPTTARATTVARPTVTARTPPAARPTARATPVKVTDPLPALQACAGDLFGVTLKYTKTGGLSASTVRTLNIATQSRGTVVATINPGSTAVYGVADGGWLETVSYYSGVVSGSDASADVSAGSLCYLQVIDSREFPADADAALALLKATFPGVPQKMAYASGSTSKGGYAFSLALTRTSGDQKVSQALLLVATKDAQGRTILSATSGTGTYTKSVPKS